MSSWLSPKNLSLLIIAESQNKHFIIYSKNSNLSADLKKEKGKTPAAEFEKRRTAEIILTWP